MFGTRGCDTSLYCSDAIMLHDKIKWQCLRIIFKFIASKFIKTSKCKEYDKRKTIAEQKPYPA